jgi:hypothetical protein
MLVISLLFILITVDANAFSLKKVGKAITKPIKDSSKVVGHAIHDAGLTVGKVGKTIEVAIQQGGDALKNTIKQLRKPVKELTVGVKSLERTINRNKTLVVSAVALYAGVPPSVTAMYFMQQHQSGNALDQTTATSDELAYFRYVAQKNGYDYDKVTSCYQGTKGSVDIVSFNNCVSTLQKTIKLDPKMVNLAYEQNLVQDLKSVPELSKELDGLKTDWDKLGKATNELQSNTFSILKKMGVCKDDVSCTEAASKMEDG